MHDMKMNHFGQTKTRLLTIYKVNCGFALNFKHLNSHQISVYTDRISHVIHSITL